MAGGGTALKHTPFYPNSDSPLHSLFLIHPALSDTVLLSEFSLFFVTKHMQGGEQEEKRSNASEATREGGSRESWYEEREERRGVDQMGGRKEGKDRSACTSARLKDSA